MNKLIISSLYFFVIACSNENSGDKKPENAAANDKETASSAGEGSTGNCSRLIFFQRGAEVEAATYNAAGEEVSRQHTKILDVKNENGVTVAYVEGSDVQAGDGKTTNVNYSYKCDGNKIYFDIASMFRTAEKQADETFEASVIEYPINVQEGETLPDAAGTMSSSKDGKKMTIKFIYKNRKVEGREMVATPAGNWNCYKISNTVESEMDIPGMDEKAKAMMKQMQSNARTTSITWFAPDFGIVKMEMYINGKLQSRNEVTAIKK